MTSSLQFNLPSCWNPILGVTRTPHFFFFLTVYMNQAHFFDGPGYDAMLTSERSACGPLNDQTTCSHSEV